MMPLISNLACERMNIKYIQIIVLALVFALQYLFEHIYPQRREINDWKNERFNLLIGGLNILLGLLPAMYIVQWLHFIDRKNLGLLSQLNLAWGLEIALTILVLDAWMYTWHRLNHKLKFLWRFHSFHHKDKKMNSTTAVRFHTMELIFSYPGKALVCFLFGIEYIPLLIYEILFFTAIVIHHSNVFITEKTDNRYRKLFASPLMHRIHHSNKWNETNSNFGALFSFWDALFNTSIKREEGKIEFGIGEELVKKQKS